MQLKTSMRLFFVISTVCLSLPPTQAQTGKVVRELGEQLFRHGDDVLKRVDDVAEAPLRRAAREARERSLRELAEEGIDATARRSTQAPVHLADDAAQMLTESTVARASREFIESPATANSLRTLSFASAEREALEAILGRSLKDGLKPSDLTTLIKRAAQRNPTGWSIAFEKHIKPNWKYIVGTTAGVAILAYPDLAFSAAGELTEWGAEASTRAGICAMDEFASAMTTGISKGVSREWGKKSPAGRWMLISVFVCVIAWILRRPLMAVGRLVLRILGYRGHSRTVATTKP